MSRSLSSPAPPRAWLPNRYAHTMSGCVLANSPNPRRRSSTSAENFFGVSMSSYSTREGKETSYTQGARLQARNCASIEQPGIALDVGAHEFIRADVEARAIASLEAWPVQRSG